MPQRLCDCGASPPSPWAVAHLLSSFEGAVSRETDVLRAVLPADRESSRNGSFHPAARAGSAFAGRAGAVATAAPRFPPERAPSEKGSSHESDFEVFAFRGAGGAKSSSFDARVTRPAVDFLGAVDSVANGSSQPPDDARPRVAGCCLWFTAADGRETATGSAGGGATGLAVPPAAP